MPTGAPLSTQVKYPNDTIWINGSTPVIPGDPNYSYFQDYGKKNQSDVSSLTKDQASASAGTIGAENLAIPSGDSTFMNNLISSSNWLPNNYDIYTGGPLSLPSSSLTNSQFTDVDPNFVFSKTGQTPQSSFGTYGNIGHVAPNQGVDDYLSTLDPAQANYLLNQIETGENANMSNAIQSWDKKNNQPSWFDSFLSEAIPLIFDFAPFLGPEVALPLALGNTVENAAHGNIVGAGLGGLSALGAGFGVGSDLANAAASNANTITDTADLLDESSNLDTAGNALYFAGSAGKLGENIASGASPLQIASSAVSTVGSGLNAADSLFPGSKLTTPADTGITPESGAPSSGVKSAVSDSIGLTPDELTNALSVLGAGGALAGGALAGVATAPSSGGSPDSSAAASTPTDTTSLFIPSAAGDPLDLVSLFNPAQINYSPPHGGESSWPFGGEFTRKNMDQTRDIQKNISMNDMLTQLGVPLGQPL